MKEPLKALQLVAIGTRKVQINGLRTGYVAENLEEGQSKWSGLGVVATSLMHPFQANLEISHPSRW